jgi:hypothetical protein
VKTPTTEARKEDDMAQLSEFTSAEIRFDREGSIVGSDADARALAPAVSDLVVIAHGWNNDDEGARRLFKNLAASLRQAVDAGHSPLGAGRAIGVLGVIWPSKKFNDSVVPAGGGGAATVAPRIGEDRVLAQINALHSVFTAETERKKLDNAAALVPHLEDKATARAAFADHLRALVALAQRDPEDGPNDFFDKPGDALMQRLAVPVALAPPGGAERRGGAADLSRIEVGNTARARAAGLPNLSGGIFGAALNLLNYTTFYEMKTRAGTVGQRGLGRFLDTVHRDRPNLRLHLVGHSFGARLVCAAALALPRRSVATLTLLQAAFSHFGLSRDWDPDNAGPQAAAFADVLVDAKVRGPILITHTANDVAVGIAYAIASRIANQVAAAVGDANDIYGGMGRNGAQRTDGTIATTLLATDGDYDWQVGVANNLLADAFIHDHGDVTGREVGHALLSAVADTA